MQGLADDTKSPAAAQVRLAPDPVTRYADSILFHRSVSPFRAKGTFMILQSPSHGGAIDAAAEKYGIAAPDWLDLSTGINATAWPIAAIDAIHWQRLPLASELDALKQAAADYYGISHPNQIACAPGTQALIQTIPFWFADQDRTATVHIIGPTYAEHALGWKRAGFRTETVTTTPENRVSNMADILQSPGGRDDIVILVNPNNPDGGLIDQTTLTELAQLATEHGKWLLIDEAFMDCSPEYSICRQSHKFERMIVLRSFGKFFGLAGLRLGCAVMPPELAAALTDRIGPWAIAGPALTIARAAFEDLVWQTDMRHQLSIDANRLDNLIASLTDLERVGGTILFRLYHGKNAAKLAHHLGTQGILVRLFDDHADRIRFGLPGTEKDWIRLEKALAAGP